MNPIGKVRPKLPSRPDTSEADSTPRRLLLVEDNPTDRELMRYLLESRFKSANIYEAATLYAALAIMNHEPVECVVLDLQLPDSTGKNTFKALNDRYPDIPLIVMTHNKDRQLALDMIQLGAADYVIKNFTDEEELFRRVLFAIEKHRHSVRVKPEAAATVHRLDRAQADMKTAHQSGQHSAIRDTSVEVTNAIADLSRRMFTELQGLSNQLTQVSTTQGAMTKTVDHLDLELLKGQAGRPSMRSQVDLMEHRLKSVEEEIDSLKEKKEETEKTQKQEAVQLTQSRLSNRTKLILGLLALVGTVAGAIATYEAATHKPPTDPAPAASTTGGKK